MNIAHNFDRMLRIFKRQTLKPQYKKIGNISYKDNQSLHTFDHPYVFTSEVCKESHFYMPLYQYWCNQLKEEPCLQRKQWEFIYIIQSLYERGMLHESSKGIGYGVGQEKLPALFANMGCTVLATDAPVEISADWYNSDQHIGKNIAKLNENNICKDETFKKKVTFDYLDMNHIPEALKDFDFCWSACAFEHLGSIDKGLEFVENSLKSLRPGGVAIHTSEYNLTSNEETLEDPALVLFRKKDYEKLVKKLVNQGHYVYPLSFKTGEGPIDHFIDLPPYFNKKPHLKLLIDKYVTTSIGIIVQKKK